tara:strand:- start:1146 stop:2246 length:1101 start_codon:yes stop_codon:yes gene_type:complete
MFVLGVNISHHPSICLLDEGEIVYYLEDDRLNKNKEEDWPLNAQMACLAMIKSYTAHVDHIIFCSYIKNKWYEFRDDLTIDQVKKNLKLYGITYDEEHFLPEHHLFHACSAFYCSPFDEAAALTCDGGGAPVNPVVDMKEAESMFYFSGNNIETIHKHHGNYDPGWHDATMRVNDKLAITHSLSNGGLFNLFTGLFSLGGAGQAMGVSPYGKAEVHPEEWFYYDQESDIWVTDNEILLDTCRRVVNCPDFDPEFAKQMDEEDLPEEASFEDMANVLAKVQLETKKHTIRLIKQLLDKTGTKNVVLSGGYFLNCVNNYHYIKEFPEINFYVDPCSHDGGTSIGAAFYVWHHLLGNKQRHPLTSLFLG